MANFLIVVDPDRERRERFAAQAAPRIACVGGLVAGRAESGDLVVLWAAWPGSPVDWFEEDGRAAVVWGDAIPGPGPARVDARALAAAWDDGNTAPAAFDGYHAAVSFAPHAGLTLGSDVLGFFPLYWAVRDGVLLAGSSPELFGLHPGFSVEVDPSGLLGLLLTHSPFAGRTLLRGVRRLPAGHALRWNRQRGAREVRQYAITSSRDLDRLGCREHVEILDQAWAEAMRRHVPAGTPVGLLLSGGRDSRLFAGYLQTDGVAVEALTFGLPSDHDARCAAGVAERAEFPHRLVETEAEALPRGAELQARWEHLAAGFSNLHTWGMMEALRESPARTVCGYGRDIREMDEEPADFDAFFRRQNRRALPLAELQRMLRRGTAEVSPEEMVARVRRDYEAAADDEKDRPWRWVLAHYKRFHVGGVPWHLCFGSWPILPILDRAVLEVLAAIPSSSLARRRAQDEILRRRFPELARLPLDRNDADVLPLLPSARARWTARVGALRRHFRHRGGKPLNDLERRRYYRVYDFNGPGWRSVRRLAEPHRERLAEWFRMDELRTYLPAPDSDVEFSDGILDSFGRKLLVGLMLWSADHPT